MQWTPGNAGLSTMIASLQLRLVATLVAEPNRNSVFHRYLLQPAAARGELFPMAPDDEIDAVTRALGSDVTTRYVCRCGHRFFIGNCGQPVVEGTCPACKAQIGGVGHAPNANTRVDAAGAAGPVRGYVCMPPPSMFVQALP